METVTLALLRVAALFIVHAFIEPNFFYDFPTQFNILKLIHFMGVIIVMICQCLILFESRIEQINE